MLLKVRDKDVIREVSRELRVPMTEVVDVGVRVLRVIMSDDVLFYVVCNVVQFVDADLARRLLRMRYGVLGREA